MDVTDETNSSPLDATLKSQLFHYLLYERAQYCSSYEFRENPSRYIRSSNYRGVEKDVYLLDMPRLWNESYYSIVLGGGDFAGARGATFGEYQRYTVELFGLRARSRPSSRNLKPPCLMKRSNPPNYWCESGKEVIQVWRTRVSLCSPSMRGTFSPDTIRAESWPAFPYCQEIWHPKQTDLSLSLFGLHKLEPSVSSTRFCADTCRILAKAGTRIGRPLGSGRYPTVHEFYVTVKRVHAELWAKNKSPPTQKEVALAMSLSISTFKQYWGRTGKPWGDLLRE